MTRVFSILAVMLFSAPLLADVRVAVVGINAETDLLQRWAHAEGADIRESGEFWSFQNSDGVLAVVAPKPTASISRFANTLYKADVALIVLDTTQGPLPVNRDHIIAARQAGVPVVAIMMANVDRLYELAPQEASEFLALEDAEIRDVLRAYEVGGSATLLIHDSTQQRQALQSAAGGLQDASEILRRHENARSPQTQVRLHQRAHGHVYLLSDPEANGNAVTISGSATLQMWSEGSTSTVAVTPMAAVRPGEVAEFDFAAADGFKAQTGSRVLMIDQGQIVGIGLLTEVARP